MDKPNLSQYFGSSEIPPASQFFDEIGTSPSEMVQSVYLGDSEGAQTATTPQVRASFVQSQEGPTDILPTVSGSTSIPVTSLPDPSTFFDTIGPDPPIGVLKTNTGSAAMITDAMDGLSIKNQPVDKEADRRRDAWIPDEEAKKTLIKAQSSPKGSFFPEREVLTMPGIVLEEELADALQEVAVKYLGVSSAGSRGVVRAEHVSRDEAGLRELLRTGYLRAAVNLTATLITAAGQGPGRMHRPTKHTPRTLQLWLTRFAVMLRIKLNDSLMKEAEPFGDFMKPDMFYQMLSNLNKNKTEDGCGIITEEDKNESTRLWSGRRVRVLHSIVNCAIALKDFRLATNILTKLQQQSTTAQQQRSLSSALCRLQLLAGNVEAAYLHLQHARLTRHHLCPTPDVREYVDLGLIDIAHGKYQDAYNNFAKAGDQEPTNIMVANNIAVCLLYMGRLKEAISVLQKAIQSDPERGLNESLLVNLCTLYELESANTGDKKLHLLRMLCKHKSDTVPNVVEALKLS
ncbi:trafficking protein particle complex subunit 12 isoform X2 [Pieris brassicae]|uniref:trafficking protein particle complex subunit 12 isoform X2 n=1 Tax=Pieris brassicae TaxID=7116 RepID=UPI001E661B8F|nr:trafficking protein particle complex subunit 12 isoform X2 [Pieris brassicae]